MNDKLAESVKHAIEGIEAQAIDMSIIVQRLFKLSHLPDNATPAQIYAARQKVSDATTELFNLVFAVDKALNRAYIDASNSEAA